MIKRILAITSWSMGLLVTSNAALAREPIAFKDRAFMPSACSRNGNTTVCSVSMENRGAQGTFPASIANELSFVDSKNVSHRPAKTYFWDSVKGPKDSHTMGKGAVTTLNIEFANLDPCVTSMSFGHGSQAASVTVVGPVVMSCNSAARSSTGVATPGESAPSQGGVPVPTVPGLPSMPMATGVPSLDRAANAVGQVNSAVGSTAQTAGTAGQTVGKLKNLKDSVKSLFGTAKPTLGAASSAENPAAPPVPAADKQ